ncbi:MAG: hypothetical protein SVR81_08120 [Chloroflexota bacterium]|nr:hypothetical protein [Chloroflexota bacterium]
MSIIGAGPIGLLTIQMARLAGGVAYQPPKADSYPAMGTIHHLARYCGVLPTVVWLDGASSGEQRDAELLDFMI